MTGWAGRTNDSSATQAPQHASPLDTLECCWLLAPIQHQGYHAVAIPSFSTLQWCEACIQLNHIRHACYGGEGNLNGPDEAAHAAQPAGTCGCKLTSRSQPALHLH